MLDLKLGIAMNNLYKNKITKRLDAMDTAELKKSWLILKEISYQKDTPVINDKKRLGQQLANGIRQLDNGEGTDFAIFINGIKKRYGKG